MHNPEVLRSLHVRRFNAEPEIFAAPGRVNLIGEHTDYAEGFVMPAAIDFATLAGISPRSDGKIVIYSENFKEERTFDRGATTRGREQALERLSAGRDCDSGWRRDTRFRIQLEPPGRCAAGVGTLEFGRG